MFEIGFGFFMVIKNVANRAKVIENIDSSSAPSVNSYDMLLRFLTIYVISLFLCLFLLCEMK